MRKIISKIAGTILGLSLAIGVGVSLRSSEKNPEPVHAADKVLEFTLTSNPGDWPTANSTTLTDYTYTLNGV